jgi:hypothetical protein
MSDTWRIRKVFLSESVQDDKHNCINPDQHGILTHARNFCLRHEKISNLPLKRRHKLSYHKGNRKAEARLCHRDITARPDAQKDECHRSDHRRNPKCHRPYANAVLESNEHNEIR